MALPDWWTPVDWVRPPKIEDVSPQGVVTFSCKLTGDPPDGWEIYFMDPQVETAFPPSGLRIEGSHGVRGYAIRGTCREEDLEKCIANIDGRIASANKKYEAQDIPAILEQEAAYRANEEAHKNRIEVVQRRANEL